MISSFLVPLYVIDALKTLRGKTRIQKLIFLIQEEVKKQDTTNLNITFEPSFYGPYSRPLADIVDILTKQNLVKERVERNNLVLYNYEITEEGKKFLNTNDIPNKLKKIIDAILAKYGGMSLTDIVNYVHKEYPQFCKN